MGVSSPSAVFNDFYRIQPDITNCVLVCEKIESVKHKLSIETNEAGFTIWHYSKFVVSGCIVYYCKRCSLENEYACLFWELLYHLSLIYQLLSESIIPCTFYSCFHLNLVVYFMLENYQHNNRACL